MAPEAVEAVEALGEADERDAASDKGWLQTLQAIGKPLLLGLSVFAVVGGLVAGVMAVVGLAILVYRRRTVGPVFSATTVMDKVMYAFLAVVILLGMWNTIAGSILTIGGEYNYREGVSVWFRSFLAFTPKPELMGEAPIGFQLHALVAFCLFALWPFTRLVHVFSAPLGYVTRPYIVYRSRDARPGRQLGAHKPRPGWDRVGS